MVTKEKIMGRLRKLEEYIHYLRDYQKVSLEQFLREHSIHSTVERDFHLAIECVLDIGNHIIADMRYRQPESYADIVIILGEEGVLPKEFAKDFSSVAKFRNILVHEYININRHIVYQFLQNKLDDFERFMVTIARFVASDVET